jgi:CBS domain containing-hemolysin-like protein
VLALELLVKQPLELIAIVWLKLLVLAAVVLQPTFVIHPGEFLPQVIMATEPEVIILAKAVAMEIIVVIMP